MISSLKDLKGGKIGLDSMIFIYAFEEHPTYLTSLKSLFSSLERSDLEAATSTLTIMERLVRPYLKKDFGLATQYLVLFRNFPHLSVHPFTEGIAERAALLRAQYRVRTPDAIQLATALNSGCHAFLTNDAGLLQVKGVQILVLDRML